MKRVQLVGPANSSTLKLYDESVDENVVAHIQAVTFLVNSPTYYSVDFVTLPAKRYRAELWVTGLSNAVFTTYVTVSDVDSVDGEPATYHKSDDLVSSSSDESGATISEDSIASIAQAVKGAAIEIAPSVCKQTDGQAYLTSGDTYSQTFKSLGSLEASSVDEILFVMKSSKSDADSASQVMVSSVNGLTVAGGSVAADSTRASIVVDDEVAGDITVTVHSDVTVLVGSSVLYTMIKLLKPGNDRTIPVTGLSVNSGVEQVS